MLITFPRRVRLSSLLGWSPTCAHHLGQSVCPLCLTFHRRESTGFLLFCLPFLPRGTHSPNPSSWKSVRPGGHLTKPAWMQGQICVGHQPLLPKLKCHTGNLRRTNEETWTVSGDFMSPAFSLSVGVLRLVLWCSFKIPTLVSLFVGNLLKNVPVGVRDMVALLCVTDDACQRQPVEQQAIKVSYRLRWLRHCTPGPRLQFSSLEHTRRKQKNSPTLWTHCEL